MTEDQTFFAMLREAPDDDATWLVFSDFLESVGRDLEAEVVRRVRELARRPFDDDQTIVYARELLAIAAPLPRAWLAALPGPDIRRHGWVSHASSDIYAVAFDDDGTIRCCQESPGIADDEPSPAGGDGAWMQIGHALAFSIGAQDYQDYSRHDGIISIARLRGIGSDGASTRWTWNLQPDTRSAIDDPMPDLPPDAASDGPPTTTIDHPLLPKRRWF